MLQRPQQNTETWNFPKSEDFNKVVQTVEQIQSSTELQELEQSAAKQLLAELSMIKKHIYDSGTLTPMLLVQMKQVVRGLINKYHLAGLLLDQTVELKLSDYSKYPNIEFKYSPELKLMMAQVIKQVNMNKEVK